MAARRLLTRSSFVKLQFQRYFGNIFRTDTNILSDLLAAQVVKLVTSNGLDFLLRNYADATVSPFFAAGFYRSFSSAVLSNKANISHASGRRWEERSNR